MKFIFKNKPPRQYDNIFVDCGDQVMAELLDIGYELKNRPHTENPAWGILASREQGFAAKEVYTFRSGAHLTPKKDGGFNVFCYAAGGEDALSALEELNMLHALRKARYHFARMNYNSAASLTIPKLSLSITQIPRPKPLQE